MKPKANIYLYLAIITIMLFAILWSLLAMEDLESKLLPLMIGSVVFLLTAAGLLNEIRARRKQREAATAKEKGENVAAQEPLRHSLVNLGWVVAFLLGIYLLGYVVAIAIFVLAYMKRLGTRWHIAVIWAILAAAFIYTGFEFGLQIPLYRGLLFSWMS